MKKLIPFLAIIAAVYIIFFFKLGERSLWDPDEPRYARAAVEMLESGDFITPTFNFENRFDKPPLIYWLTALAYKIFGVSEFSARFFPAVCGLGAVMLTYLTGALLINKKAGFFAAFILATSAKFVVLSKACTTDIILCFFITLAVFLFLKKRLILSFAAMALAVLTKGPIGIVLPVAVFGAFIIFARKREYISIKGIFIGGILFLIIALPWYYLVISRHGEGYVKSFFLFHHFERFFSSDFQHAEPFYYYIPMVLAGFLPWSVFLPWLIRHKHRIFLVLWAIIPIVMFSAAKAKLPSYILPVFPALAIMAGDFFASKNWPRAFALTAIFAIVLGVIALCFVVPRFDPERSGRAVSEAAKELSRPGDKFATYKFFKPSFVFYSQRKVYRLETEQELLDFLFSPEGAFVFLKTSDYAELINTNPAIKSLVIAEAGRYVVVSGLEFRGSAE